MVNEADIQRFLEKVKVGPGCWEWTASLNANGYGQFSVHGKIKRAHRVSFEIHKGDIPSGLLVMHSCDNPKCVNPSHLSLGTNADNVRDCIAKGRHALKAKFNIIRALPIPKNLIKKRTASIYHAVLGLE